MPDTDHSRIEELLYYLNLMAGRNFSGSFIVWMYGGRISHSTFKRLRKQLTIAGVPFADRPAEEEAHAEA